MFHILISSWLLDHPKTSHIVLGDGENELRTYCAPSHTAPGSMRIRNESKLVFIFSDHPSGGVYYIRFLCISPYAQGELAYVYSTHRLDVAQWCGRHNASSFML